MRDTPQGYRDVESCYNCRFFMLLNDDGTGDCRPPRSSDDYIDVGPDAICDQYAPRR